MVYRVDHHWLMWFGRGGIFLHEGGAGVWDVIGVGCVVGGGRGSGAVVLCFSAEIAS